MHWLNENWPCCWIFAYPNLDFSSVSQWFSMSIPVWAIENTWKRKKRLSLDFHVAGQNRKRTFSRFRWWCDLCVQVCLRLYICLCAHIFSLLFVLLMLFFIFLVGQKLCLLFLVFFTQNKSLDTDMFGKEKYIFLLRYNQLLLLTRNFQSIFICISSLQKDYLSWYFLLKM